MAPIPRIYANEICPLEDYESFSVRVLQNSTDAEWRDWLIGNLGAPDCPTCAALRQPRVVRGKRKAAQPASSVQTAPGYCPACTLARAQFGRAAVAFFGPGTPDLDFSSVDAALATLERDDLPSELLMWLTMLPGAVRARRHEDLAKNLTRSSTTQS